MCKYTLLAACGVVVLAASSLEPPAGPAAPEPGPESDGLRLRLMVTPRCDSKEGYEVRVDVLNASDRAVAVRANWPYEDDKGDLKDYLESAMALETYPAIAPILGQTMERQRRKSAQPEQVLRAGEVLSLKWQTDRRRLKNTSFRGCHWGENPEFPLPGLYSVHATVVVSTTGGPVLLRSNEQLVSVGGSHEMPRHTYGSVLYSYPDTQTAMLNLGALHQTKAGDQFEIGTGIIGEAWKLTITRVEQGYSEGKLEVMHQNPSRTPPFPKAGSPATLMMKKPSSQTGQETFAKRGWVTGLLIDEP